MGSRKEYGGQKESLQLPRYEFGHLHLEYQALIRAFGVFFAIAAIGWGWVTVKLLIRLLE
jgi:hypothetical protein